MGLALAFLFMRPHSPKAEPKTESKAAATSNTSDQEVIDRFHHLYYNNDGRTWSNTRWLGVLAQKTPLDFWIYQEILYEIKPDVLIECGTYSGGSALYFASIMDLLKKGRVLSIDIVRKPDFPEHPRIHYLTGSSVSKEMAARVQGMIKPGEVVMVSLDSDHARDHVLQELRTYSPMVTVGSYLVVEDTNINGHPVYPTFGPGPMEALDAFLATNSDFTSDREREKFFLTFNPKGYLKKLR